MELRNCPECGKVFTYIRTNLCPACQKKDEDTFRVVRTFITRNPGADIITVCTETGVSEEKVMRYIREGRINHGFDSMTKCECEVCGVLIPSGRLCQTCNDKLTAGLKRSIQEENKNVETAQDRKGPRMYTADHWINRK